MYPLYIKRLLDILLSIILLPFLMLIFIPVAIAIKLEDGGPIFFLGERYGKNMKVFKMYKFRSMIENAPDIRNNDGTTFNSSNDTRVTKVGKFLRQTSIDELPQIINVIIGDMSFIGPRPSPLGDKSIYPKDFFDKFKVLPGITGYSQAKVRNNANMNERIALDKYYVNNISLILDIKVLILTIKTVLLRKNINRQ